MFESMAIFKSMLNIGGPVFISTIFWYLTHLITTVLVGRHYGIDELAAVGLGNVFINMFGASIIRGISSALDNLSTQAFQAGRLTQIGEYGRRAVMVLFVVVLVPVGLLCYFAEPVMIYLHQTEEVASLVYTFTRRRIPGLVFFTLSTCLNKSLNVLSLTKPGMWASASACVVTLPLAWLIIAHWRYGSLISLSLSLSHTHTHTHSLSR